MVISFDVWGTLIKSNPEFKKQQAILAKEMYGISEEDFISNMKNVKSEFNILVEQHGFHIPRELIYQKVFNKYDVDFHEFIKESNNLFLNYQPIPLFKNGSEIHKLMSDNKCLVTSNTVMIYGDVLSSIVNYYYQNITSHCMIFSDEVNVSKPNSLIWLQHWLQHNSKIDLHIGDNVVTDGACEKLGIKFQHINDYL